MNTFWLSLKPWQRRLALEGVLTVAALAGMAMGVREYTPGGSDTPSASGVGEQYTSLLNALVGGMPTELQAQSTYQPQFTNLGLQNLNQELTGSAGTPGYLDLYQNLVAPALTQTGIASNTATRGANVSDLGTFGPGLTSALKATSPGTAGLVDTLTQTAGDQLKLGATLDPATVSQITSGVRTNWANRGLGTSNPAQLDEALQLYAGGQNLLGTREAAAGSAANLGYNLYTSPALDVLGMSSNAPAQAQGFTSTASGTGAATGSGSTSLFNPSDLASLFNLTYNADAATSIGNANNASAICGSAIGAGGSVLGGGLSGYMGGG